jgi:hypothetical protein
VGGLITVFAPFVAGMVANYAPDSSIQLGRNIENDSVELRLRRRLPLKERFSVLPNRGLVGGAAVLLVLVPIFLMVLPQES